MMETLHAIAHRALRCGLALALSLGGVSLAQADDAFDAFMSRTVGNSTTVSFGTNGTPLASSSAPVGIPTVGKMGISQTSEGVFLDSLGKTKGPGGVDVPIAAKLKMTAKAVGRGLYRATPLLAAAGLVSDVAQIWTDLGYPLTDGVPMVGTPGACTVAPCYEYYNFNFNGNFVTQSCSATAALLDAAYPIGGGQTRICTGSPSGGQGGTQYACASGNMSICNQINYSGRTVAPAAPSAPLTEQDFLDAVATRSGWPSGTALAMQKSLSYPEVRDQVEEDLKAAPAPTPTVKFKPTPTTEATTQTIGTPKVTSSSKTLPSGAVETTQKTDTTTGTAAGDKITYQTTSVTNIYNNTTNETTTITETKEEEPDEQCKDGDQTLGCAEVDTPEGEIPKATRTLTYSDTNMFGTGSCPADVMVSVGGQQHKAIDYSGDVCPMVATYVRPLVIAIAGFMCLMILIPGVKPE